LKTAILGGGREELRERRLVVDQQQTRLRHSLLSPPGHFPSAL